MQEAIQSSPNHASVQKAAPVTPILQRSSDDQVAHNHIAYTQPVHHQTAYNQTAYNQPTYNQTAYKQPTNEQSTNNQPTYKQPTNDQTIYNQTAFDWNANLSLAGPATPTSIQPEPVTRAIHIPAVSDPPAVKIPASAPSNLAAPKALVVIPPPSAEARKSDFVTYEDSSVEDRSSRKRKREYGTDMPVQVSQTRDQRAASDEILRQFEETVQELFAADEQADPHPHFFLTARHDGREVNTLAPAMHVKLEASLQKITSFGRMGEISVHNLQRLQGLCEGALASAEDSDLHRSSDSNLQDEDGWMAQLETADLSLRSARTILRIMTGGRPEKELYSEELLQGILRALQKVTDSCIVPTVEARTSSSATPSRSLAPAHIKALSQIVHGANKVMGLLAKLLVKEEMAETIITPIEFFAIRLMFVENAPTDKESVLGVRKFEILRRTSMDIIAIIFSRYDAQRAFLFDEILTSLQRLPTGRQAARQFRLADGRAIQLVTALIIRLVQTSATISTAVKETGSRRSLALANGGKEFGAQGDASDGTDDGIADGESASDSDGSDAGGSRIWRRLGREADALCGSAAKSAQHAVGYLMQRAQTSSKTGDQPHRQLLDIFVEDLLMTLGLPEWPGAELLLRAVCARASHIFENPKSLAPAKNMALELLGTMGAAISDLVANTRIAVKGLENHESEYSGYLSQMLADYADGSLETSELLLWEGPYHAVVAHLEPVAFDDLQSVSAQAYYLAQWAKAAASGASKAGPDGERLAVRLRAMLSGGDVVHSDAVRGLSAGQSQVAYALTVLNMDFCRRFDYMLRILLDSVTSEQTTVRSRGLKSVTQMLERDPSILDRARNVKNIIMRCAVDTSPMVRDAALTLIGKCIALKPALEAEFLHHILRLSSDAAIGVRKRAMKLLKDIYLRNSGKDVKAAVGDSLLQRVQDPDTAVADLARQTIEEIWIAPFWTAADLSTADVQVRISLQNQMLLIVGTASRSAGVRALLFSLLKGIMSKQAKNAAASFKVCRALVATAFEVMVDPAGGAGFPAQGQILETLTIFAKANPRLFLSDQLQFLQPYVGSISKPDDLDLFRPVVVIFRCVLPVLSTVEHGLLENIQNALLKSVSKLSKAELDEVAECLWTITAALQNLEPLVKLIASVIKNLHAMRGLDFARDDQRDNLARLRKYVQIAGYFGKHCDLESYAAAFQSILPWFQGGSVAGLIVQCLQPFTADPQPLQLRAVAFDGIGLVCQSWPFQFTHEAVSQAFGAVLQSGPPELQEIILSNFRDFFTSAERQMDSSSGSSEDAGGEGNAPKLGGSMVANERDSASALITQHFLKAVLSIALASQGDAALTATEVIASINRQGLAHPKESGPALVALGTSSNAAIAKIASHEHRTLHQQHESMFEREYMRAIQETFAYQRDIVKDTLGFTSPPLTAKLNGMWEVIKTSKGKYQKKFLSNYCSKIDFDPATLDVSGTLPMTLQYSRFLVENLAFFDYTRLDELLHTIACMEKTVAGTGSGVAHSISTEIFRITLEARDGDAQQDERGLCATPQRQASDDVPSEVPQPPRPQGSANDARDAVHPLRLRQLTTASIILSSLWEARTYLRRLYGQSAGQHRREGAKVKPATKDLSKAPTRVQGVSGEKLCATIADKVAALNGEDAMTRLCGEFVDLLSVDSEVRVNAESEESLGDQPGTPGAGSDSGLGTPMGSGPKGLKRKGVASAAGTPSKKRGRPPLGRKRSSRKSVDRSVEDGDWD